MTEFFNVIFFSVFKGISYFFESLIAESFLTVNGGRERRDDMQQKHSLAGLKPGILRLHGQHLEPLTLQDVSLPSSL